MKRIFITLLILLLAARSEIHSQETPTTPDSVKSKTVLPSNLPMHRDSLFGGPLPIKLPRLNPIENHLPQYTPYQSFTLTPQPSAGNGILPPIHWQGAASDFLFSKSRTAIATTLPTPRLLLHSSGTLCMVETPFFGKGYLYIVDAGAQYAVSRSLMLGISGGYNSNFDVMPYWNIGMDARYQINRNLMVDGGLTYLKSGNTMYNVNQSAALIDLHGRYRINNDWYLNAYGGMPVWQRGSTPTRPMMPMMNTPYYGGSIEHWFKPTMGVEAGMLWIRDMYSGKMRPQPKLELLFRPGR